MTETTVMSLMQSVVADKLWEEKFNTSCLLLTSANFVVLVHFQNKYSWMVLLGNQKAELLVIDFPLVHTLNGPIRKTGSCISNSRFFRKEYCINYGETGS